MPRMITAQSISKYATNSFYTICYIYRNGDDNDNNQPYSKYKHLLTFCIRRYVVVAMKLVHWLQIHAIVHN